MASTASTVLRLEKMPTGENTGTWGPKNNLNLEMLEAAAGCGAVVLSDTGGTVTLTNVDYTNDQAKKRVIRCTGTLVSNLIIVVPNVLKTYVVVNATAGAYTVTIKTSSGSAIAVTQGSSCEVACDGSNVMTYISPMVVNTTGAPTTASGAVASSVAVTPTGNLASSNAQAALAELQTDVDGRQATHANLTSISGLAVTKGNLIAGTGTALAVLSVGTDNTLPLADSAAATGIKWAALGVLIAALAAETTIATDDEIILGDTSESGAANRMTVANFLKVVNALTADATPDSAADYVMTYDASAGAAKKVLLANFAAPGMLLAILEDQKTANTAGGTFTTGAWRTRTLQTEVYDRGSFVSISSNEFTLAAGAYEIEWSAPAFSCNRHKSRLFDVTNTLAYLGTAELATVSGADAQTRSFGSVRLSLAGSTAFRIEHYSEETQSTNGFGLPANLDSTIEVYTRVVIRRG